MPAPQSLSERVASRLWLAFGRLAGIAAAGAILLYCFLGNQLLMRQLPKLLLLDEVGYGDSYVLYDIQQYGKTGVLYRDLAQPPYTPTVYSPLMYKAFALPDRLIKFYNPFIGPRLVALAAFLLCLWMAISLTRALVPAHTSWFWGLLLTGSIASIHPWVLQIRGDFLAAFCGLAAVRLLLVGSPWAMIAAGAFAGLATQFKFTMVAALAAGALWLGFQRRWPDLKRFAAAGLVSSIGLYAVLAAVYPRMLAQLLSLRINRTDIPGCIELVIQVLSEPVVLLALAAIPVAWHTAPKGWGLLIPFAAISFAIATLANFHPGGNINYFYEALFAIVPAATVGALKLMEWSRRRAAVGLLVAAVFALHFAFPKAGEVGQALASGEIGYGAVGRANLSFQRKSDALSGWRIFSTVERLALLDQNPPLISAFNLWAVDPEPIYKRLKANEFDVVVTPTNAVVWRGMAHITPGLHQAIAGSYRPYCSLGFELVHIPQNRRTAQALVNQLARGGCAELPDGVQGTW